MSIDHQTELAGLLTPVEEHGGRYNLQIREQPVTAVQSRGLGDENGMAVHPPPVVELSIKGGDVEGELLNYQHILYCWIDEEKDAQQKSLMSSDRETKPLLGSLVSIISTKQDKSGKYLYQFVFSNILCQTVGSFRLKFGLFRTDPTHTEKTKDNEFLCTVDSKVFTVHESAESQEQGDA